MEERIPCYYHYLSSHLAPGAIPGASRLIIVAEVAWVCPSAAEAVAALAVEVAWVCPSAAEAAELAAAEVAWVCPSAAEEVAASAAEVAELVVESAAELVIVLEPASAALTVAYTSRALQPSCHPVPRS